MASEEEVLYEGRQEGPIRKCHRLSQRADYFERCEKFSQAAECHQQAATALTRHLNTQLSVRTRRQVSLLLRRHHNRAHYLRMRNQERQQQQSLVSSCYDATDGNTHLYLSHNPAMLVDMKKSQVQFNNIMEHLHLLTNPEEIAAHISDNCEDRREHVMKIDSNTCNSTSLSCEQQLQNPKQHVRFSESALDRIDGSTTTCIHEDLCKSSQDRTTDPREYSKVGTCKKCSKSFEVRLNEEEALTKITTDLPMLWKTRDRMLQAVFTDYSKMTKARDALKDQVQQLTYRLEQNLHQTETEAQLMSCSNITYNTSATDPDLATSDTALRTSPDFAAPGEIASILSTMSLSNFPPDQANKLHGLQRLGVEERVSNAGRMKEGFDGRLDNVGRMKDGMKIDDSPMFSILPELSPLGILPKMIPLGEPVEIQPSSVDSSASTTKD